MITDIYSKIEDDILFSTSHPIANVSNNRDVCLRKLYDLFPFKIIYLMDLGCGSGEFVKKVRDDGHEAIGIEGAPFPCMPNYVKSADITKPFAASFIKQPFFDVITAWDVLQEIQPIDMYMVVDNICDHLDDNGVFIANTYNRAWWLKLLEAEGLCQRDDLVKYFGENLPRGCQNELIVATYREGNLKCP